MKESMMELNLAVMENVNGGDEGPLYETEEGRKRAMEILKKQKEFFDANRGTEKDLGGLIVPKTDDIEKYDLPDDKDGLPKVWGLLDVVF